MTALTIIVLVDPRWPDQIPLGIIPYLYGVGVSHLEVTPDIPAAARDHYHQLAALPAPSLLQPVARLVITSDDADPRLMEPTKTAAETATRIFRVPSRDDPAWQAQNIMRRALTVGEWEREQTHETLLPYLWEETTELAEAITTQADDVELMAELGDVLLQVLFHAEIAARGVRSISVMWWGVSLGKCDVVPPIYLMGLPRWCRSRSRNGCGNWVNMWRGDA